MKFQIWGTGFKAVNCMIWLSRYRYEDEIISFIDNASELWGRMLHGIKIISPEEVRGGKMSIS